MSAAEGIELYVAPGPFTEPRSFRPLLAALPADPARLCEIVQGLLVHVFWAERQGRVLTDADRASLNLRSVAAKLGLLLAADPRPLDCPRPLELRQPANCRDHSLLLTAILRAKGIPARARCGFGTYFIPGHFEDHWVCEVWRASEGRWTLVDAQLDALQRERLGIDFDPCDVPRDRFLCGGAAWRLCRGGAADPGDFGIDEYHGLWFVAGDLIRDVASLCGIETLPWDAWGLVASAYHGLAPGELELLDRLADLSAGDVPDAAALRALYKADPRLRVPEALLD